MEALWHWFGDLPFEPLAIIGGIAALVALRRSMRRTRPNHSD